MAEPKSTITTKVASLIKTCTKIGLYLDKLKAEIEFAHITVALLSVECTITSWNLSQLEQALLSKPNLLAMIFKSKRETLACLEMGVEGYGTIISLADQELDKLKGELLKPDVLDSKQRGKREERLKELTQHFREQGSSASFLLTCVKLNCDAEDIPGISSIAKAALRRNFIKTKTLQSKFPPSKGSTPASPNDHVPESSKISKPVVDKPLPRSPEPEAKSTPTPTKDGATLGDLSRSPKSPSIPNGSGGQSGQSKNVKNTDIHNSTEFNTELLAAIRAGISKDDVTDVRARLREGVDIDCMAPTEQGANVYSFLAIVIEAGSANMTQLLLDYGAEPESIAVPSMGYTALHWAASRNQIEIVKMLLQEGANVTKQTSKFSETALFVACRKNHAALARLLLQGNGNKVLDTADCDGRTPLLQAVFHGWSEVVEVLLQAGADVLRKDGDGNTALHIAAKEGHATIAQLLVNRNVEIDARDLKSQTPLHVASIFGHTSIVMILMEQGAELDARDSDKRTPLHIAVRDNRFEVVKLLILWKANIEAEEEDEWTPLQFAVQNKRHEIADFLLESGAKADTLSKTGRSPLMSAATNNDMTSMMSLCEYGANVSLSNIAGWTAIHFASEAGSVNALQFLISQGVPLEQSDIKGWTALHFAAKAGSVAALNFLISQGASLVQAATDGSTALIVAASHGHVEAVKAILEAKMEVDHRGGKKITALYAAAQNGHDTVCTVLLDHGAIIDSVDDEGKTPLMAAAARNHVPVIKLLLVRGSKIDAQHSSQCALYKAALFGKLDATKALLDAGALVNNATSRGGTPLHIAAYKGRRSVVELLLRSGADRSLVSTHDNVKGTPAEAARSQGFDDIADLIANFDKDATETEISFIADDSGHIW